MKYFLIGMFLILFFLSCSLSSAETVYVNFGSSDEIIDLGIIYYSNTAEKVLTVKINNCSEEIILLYLFSDINSSALSIESSWFSPIDNQTTVIFKTNKILPEWYFKNNTRQFVYIDDNSKSLFRVYINYSSINLPENPLIALSNENSALYENLTIVWEDYNQTYEKLIDIGGDLSKKWNQLNNTKTRFDKLNETVIQLQKDNEGLQEGIIEQTNQTNKYKAWYKTKTDDYDRLRNKAIEMDSALGKWPFIFVGSIFLAIFLMFIWDRRNSFLKKTLRDRNKNVDGKGLTSMGKIVNKIFSRKNNKNPDIEQNKIDESNVEKIVEMKVIEEKKDIESEIKTINSRIDSMEKKQQIDFDDLSKRIDNILSKKPTRAGG